MNKKLIYKLLGVIFGAGALFFLTKVILSTYAPSDVATESFAPTTTYIASEADYELIEPDTSVPRSEVEYTDPVAQCPVDFEALRLLNKDIYGWIVIDDTNINYPVLQNGKNDKFYLNHNSDGDYSSNGSIFSEHKYNNVFFTDNVTILYGHHLRNGKFFGKLQKYFTDDDFLSKNPTIKVYTESGLREYEFFAAVPFSKGHLFSKYDFSKESDFNKFVDSVFNVRDLNARYNKECRPVWGDKIIILSTCLQGNNTKRFLVMGRLLPQD